MKLVSLVSSGIDSPVATYLVSKKVEEIILVHGDNTPFTDKKERDAFITIAKHLKRKIPTRIKAFIIPHGKTLSSYTLNCTTRFTCVFCKRMLVRYAEKIAEYHSSLAIVMGDSLGQVASQTLQNIRVIEQATYMPILRPLIGLDKEDVIRIAKNIGTYDISILPSDGCSAVPSKPATRARLEDVITEEKKIDVNKIVDQAIKNAELISF